LDELPTGTVMLFRSTILKSSIAIIASALSLSINANVASYTEVGLGAAKWHSTSNSSYSEIDPSAALKVSAGARLSQDIGHWFDLSLIAESSKRLGDDKVTSYYLLPSYKYTSNPIAPRAYFAKVGAGLLFAKDENTTLNETKNSRETVYLAAIGTSQKLSERQSVTFEFQTTYLDNAGVDLFNNVFTISISQYL